MPNGEAVELPQASGTRSGQYGVPSGGGQCNRAVLLPCPRRSAPHVDAGTNNGERTFSNQTLPDRRSDTDTFEVGNDDDTVDGTEAETGEVIPTSGHDDTVLAPNALGEWVDAPGCGNWGGSMSRLAPRLAPTWANARLCSTI